MPIELADFIKDKILTSNNGTHVVIVTQARTVNALFKNYFIVLTVRCSLSVRLVGTRSGHPEHSRGMTDRSFPPFSGIERHPGFKLYRPVLQVFVLETYLATLPNTLSLVKETILYY
ncbi:hypothetical protein HYS84_02330 [Candidatus Saccharibacteria bacterium]|nr:hypothetical protein [Candidatus Saccharibacteria bacterium]